MMNTEKRIPDACGDRGTGKKQNTQRTATNSKPIAPAGRIYFLPTNWLAIHPGESAPRTSIQIASAVSKPLQRTTLAERKTRRHLSLIFSPAISLCIIQDSFRRQGFHCRIQSRPIVKTYAISEKKQQIGTCSSQSFRNLPDENIVLNAGIVPIEESQAGIACNAIVCSCRIISSIHVVLKRGLIDMIRAALFLEYQSQILILFKNREYSDILPISTITKTGNAAHTQKENTSWQHT